VILYAHVFAGSLALLAGYVALFAPKGAWLHRRSGVVFVGAMLAMAFAGLTIAVMREIAPSVNIPAALLVAYLVITALVTVRPLASGFKAFHYGALSTAVALALVEFAFALEAIRSGASQDGIPAFPFLLFGVVSLFGAIGDARVLRHGVRKGPSRLARHLWRMCAALLIAALSFFIGQSDVIPAPVRLPLLLALPLLVVIALMIYWLRRVRVRAPVRVR
jgi:uncharacterized membrane protein